jgi:uncharacterized Ntn-hydrolase superfamily protein
MKNFYIIVILSLFALNLRAQDTFSIIAVDPVTGEVGSAGASCVTGAPSGWDAWITDIIPGKGGVNSQAYICIPNTNLQGAMERMALGDSPQEIIDWLLLNDSCSSQNFNPDYRQYGIVDLDSNGDPRAAGWSGPLTDDYKEDRQGANYSIQGNILWDVSVVDNMESNFNSTSGTLADKLMAALQGANFPGADSRCLSNGTSSRAAYMVVYKADDTPGQPYLRLTVPTQGSGIEPIDVLQDLYDQFLAVNDNPLNNKVEVYPNPAINELKLQLDASIIAESIEVFDINGKLLHTEKMNSSSKSIDISRYAKGLYFLKLNAQSGEITVRFVKK